MEQNDVEVNQMLNVRSRNGEGEKSVTELRSKISLSNFQMLELTHNDQKFTDRLFELNQNGINSIHHGNYEQALLYLTQAQKLLEYAASCGRAIDRQIILKILNNEAVVYQKTWDLERSISYVEAIIFNLQTFLNSRQCVQSVEGLRQKFSDVQNQNSSFQQEDLEWYLESQVEKLKTVLSKKYQLSLYFLQFSCLNSQNQDHEIGLKNAHDALRSFRETFQLSFMFIKLKKALKIDIDQQSYKLLQQVTSISLPTLFEHELLAKRLQQIQKAFQRKSHAPSSFNYILQKYSSLQKKQARYKNFSLTSVMELHSKSIGDKMILDDQKNSQTLHYIDEIENFSLLSEKVLEYAITFFTISVEIKQLNSESTPSPKINPSYMKMREQQHKQKIQESQIYYLVSLKLSVQLVEELSQFSRYAYKHYFEIYSHEKIKNSGESMSKMDSLKEKYKKYLPEEKSKKDSRNIDDSDDQFCDNTISQYSINIRLSLVNNPKDSKENKLEKLFKENAISTPQNVVNQAPPRLNVDISQIQSLEYEGSKTFKQNNSEISNNLYPDEIIQEEKEDNKQTKKLNCLHVKKIKTVPNLSDVSSNKDSKSQSRQKSQRSRKSKVEKPNKSKQKSPLKQTQSKKNLKSNSNTSRQKLQIKRFLSPKNINRKSFQAYISSKSNKAYIENEGKKKINISEKKIFSDRKTVINGDRQNDKSKKNNKLLVFKQKKKKSEHIITPQPSARNISQKDETQRNAQKQKDQKLIQTKKVSKLRKAKSFEQIIHPYEDIKPPIYQSKNISDTYNIYPKPKLKQKLKFITEIKKAKSSENLKFTVKNGKKNRKKMSKIEPLNNNLSQNTEAINLLETKDSVIKKKRKSNVSLHKEQYNNSAIGWQNAVRMSSVSNLMNSGNDRLALKKLNSSKSLHESNQSSGYLLKGLNVNASQRTKAESIVMTKSLRKKG